MTLFPVLTSYHSHLMAAVKSFCSIEPNITHHQMTGILDNTLTAKFLAKFQTKHNIFKTLDLFRILCNQVVPPSISLNVS